MKSQIIARFLKAREAPITPHVNDIDNELIVDFWIQFSFDADPNFDFIPIAYKTGTFPARHPRRHKESFQQETSLDALSEQGRQRLTR